MAELWDFWVKQWDSWPVQLVVWGVVLALLVVIAVFVVRRLRDSTFSNDSDPAHLLANFREMRVQGDIDDKEFRTINSLLNAKQAPTVKHTQDST
jgi:uncharacterized membrane protein